MQATEFDKLATFEGWYWWYRAQRANLVETVRRLPLPRGAKVLDAGCGTGRNLAAIIGNVGADTYGIDVSLAAASIWQKGDVTGCCTGSVNDLPYPDATFEVVTSVDVLQEKSVDPRRAIGEMTRVLRVGGHLVLLAPAYQWMLSRHDVAVDSVRRFTRRQLVASVERASLTVEQATYRFGWFLPVIAGKRLWDKLAPGSATSSAESDLRPIPAWLNCALSFGARMEHHASRLISPPFGSTVLVVARKGAA